MHQVLVACRVGGSQQSAIDALVDSHLPGMAPLGDVTGAAECMNDHAHVPEASRPTKSEGAHPAQRQHTDANCAGHYSSERICDIMLKTFV